MNSIYYNPNSQKEKSTRKWFKNVKLIGEVDEGTSIYIEDYAYTYLHQCASKDLSYELCAVLIGKQCKESSQVIIYGVIPVNPELINSHSKWIDENVLDALEEKRKCYFPEGEYVGWMHTQPGYGIMATTQEIAIHKDIFGEDCVLMLIDPIYDSEAFFAYEGDKLTQKKGFCMFYEKNEQMQKYMEQQPVVDQKEEEVSDKAVGDFRELGARRKREVERRKKRSRVVSVTLAGVLLTLAFAMGIYTQQKKINVLKEDVVNIHQQYSEIENKTPDNPVEIVFTSAQDKAEDEPESEPEVKEELEVEPESEVKHEPKEDVHVVEIGDTLQNISYYYYDTVSMAKDIAKLNGIIDYDAIYIGQQLKLP